MFGHACANASYVRRPNRSAPARSSQPAAMRDERLVHVRDHPSATCEAVGRVLVGRARALVDAVERDELGQRAVASSAPDFGDRGELRGDRAPAVGEAELFVLVRELGVGVPDDDAVVGALRMIART